MGPTRPRQLVSDVGAVPLGAITIAPNGRLRMPVREPTDPPGDLSPRWENPRFNRVNLDAVLSGMTGSEPASAPVR